MGLESLRSLCCVEVLKRLADVYPDSTEERKSIDAAIAAITTGRPKYSSSSVASGFALSG